MVICRALYFLQCYRRILLLVFIWSSACFPCGIPVKARSSQLPISGWILNWKWNCSRNFVQGKIVIQRCVVLSTVHSKPGRVHYVCFVSHDSDAEVDTPRRNTAVGLSQAAMGVCPLWMTAAAQWSCTVSPRHFGDWRRVFWKCSFVICIINSLGMLWAMEKNKPEAHLN